jgi:hypothetical protein
MLEIEQQPPERHRDLALRHPGIDLPQGAADLILYRFVQHHLAPDFANANGPGGAEIQANASDLSDSLDGRLTTPGRGGTRAYPVTRSTRFTAGFARSSEMMAVRCFRSNTDRSTVTWVKSWVGRCIETFSMLPS